MQDHRYAVLESSEDNMAQGTHELQDGMGKSDLLESGDDKDNMAQGKHELQDEISEENLLESIEDSLSQLLHTVNSIATLSMEENDVMPA